MISVLKSLLTALAVAIVAAMPAVAQAPARPAAPAPSAASIALAKDIMVSKQAGEFYKGAVSGLVQQSKATFLQSNLTLDKDLTAVAAQVAKDLAGRENEIGDQMAKIYASLFTEQELRDLASFYKSPLGKKVIDSEPRAMEQSMMFANEWSQKFSDEIVQRFKAEMKKRGKDI